MRVIAGTAKGRKLVAPRGQQTRPTPGRVREALFSILAPRLAGARLLDLFAGSGALGVEGLSRGAASAVFVEHDRPAQSALRRNVAPFGPRAKVLAMPAWSALRLLAGQHHTFDVVFVDPPYQANLWDTALQILVQSGLLAEAGVVVCEHPGQRAPPAPPAGWHCWRSRIFGDVAVSLFGAAEGHSS